MDNFDQFERSLAAALRSDADQSVAHFEPATVARAAMARPQRRSLRLPWKFTVGPRSNRWALTAAAVIGVLAIGGVLLLNRTDRPIVGGPTPSTESSPGLPSVTPAPSATPTASELAEPTAAPTSPAVTGPAGAWVATGSMGTPRFGHTAVRLLDGRVLVAGGSGGPTGGNDPEFVLTAAELYDPDSGTWSATGSMLKPHGCCGFPATQLRDGKVLVSDVDDPTVNDGIPGAEVYDPATGTWSSTGKLAITEEWTAASTVTLLANGKVLVAGSSGAELYDPDNGTWSATGKMTTARYNHTATLLPDGKVLVAGGDDMDSAELYDPETGAWTAIASMHAERDGFEAFLRPDGKVLVMGGSYRDRGNAPDSVELYDPATGEWTAIGDMPGADISGNGSATLLSDGTVFVTGDFGAEVYDPETGSWTTVGSALLTHPQAPATLLLDGTVLVAGGWVCSEAGCPTGATGSAELYIPAGVSPPPAVAALPSPSPFPTPTPSPPPRPVPPAVGPFPPGARTWTVTVDNKSSEPATLFAAEEDETGPARLCGKVTPNVVPPDTTMKVTFLLPPKNVTSCWIWVNPVPGEGGSFFQTSDAPLKGGFHIDEGGQVMWG
jgi:Kelch motif/Galactose oxidase, central domain